MVAEDRRLRLAGYEVYRFGGYELTQKQDSVVWFGTSSLSSMSG